MKTRFKGHETFFFREGWISKVFFEINAMNNTHVFSGNNGVVKLGMGANMVKSVKYWMITCGLLEYKNKTKTYELTKLGQLIATHDIYLESIFSLWLLHIYIVRNYSNATTWNLFFNKFKADNFSIKELKYSLRSYLDVADIKYSDKSLDADVNVLVSMYSKRVSDLDAEENFLCPLSRLGLMRYSRDKYERVLPDLKDVNSLIVLYVILLQIKDKGHENDKERFISIAELETMENSVANIFNFNRVIINEYLDQLSAEGFIRQEKTAGLDMVYITCDYTLEDIIKLYYEKEGLYES